MINFKVDDLKLMSRQLSSFAEYLKLNSVSDDDVFSSRLVSSELISNVIRHGGGSAEFSASLLPDKIVITVVSKSFRGVSFDCPAPDVFSESGRGLYIVRSLAYGEIERGDGGEVTVYIKRT